MGAYLAGSYTAVDLRLAEARLFASRAYASLLTAQQVAGVISTEASGLQQLMERGAEELGKDYQVGRMWRLPQVLSPEVLAAVRFAGLHDAEQVELYFIPVRMSVPRPARAIRGAIVFTDSLRRDMPSTEEFISEGQEDLAT